MQTPFIKYIANTQHYDDVLARVASVKKTLWIGTADIKDVYIKSGTAFPALWSAMEMTLCPRVHFKLMIFDMETAYIGSANLTGAGIGMKSGQRRNFETGILTNEPTLVEAAINQFDEVWRGKFCAKCGRKSYCNDQIR